MFPTAFSQTFFQLLQNDVVLQYTLRNAMLAALAGVALVGGVMFPMRQWSRRGNQRLLNRGFWLASFILATVTACVAVWCSVNLVPLLGLLEGMISARLIFNHLEEYTTQSYSRYLVWIFVLPAAAGECLIMWLGERLWLWWKARHSTGSP